MTTKACTKDHIDSSRLNMVFRFGEIFVPKRLNIFDKFIIWISFHISDYRHKRAAYREALRTGNRQFKYEDFLELNKELYSDPYWNYIKF